jgi:two-component system, NtrC family, response regulator AtoC
VPRILVADDERSLRDALARFIRSLHMEVVTVGSGDEAAALLSGCDLLITDLRMPGLDGMGLLAEARRRRPELPVILLTGHASGTRAVDAMRAGAANFLTKPFELDELEHAIRTALGVGAAPAPIPTRVATRPGEVILGESGAAQALRLLTTRAAASAAAVLITGEPGAGKEVVARAVHAESPRAASPFVVVSCGKTLLESELLGHVKGDAPGAPTARTGPVGAADGGALFLD